MFFFKLIICSSVYISTTSHHCISMGIQEKIHCNTEMYVNGFVRRLGWSEELLKNQFLEFTKLYVYLLFFVYRENFPSHFKFKEYCPLVFRQLRDRFGIDDSEYAVSADAACVTCMFIYHSATLQYVILLGTNKLK